MLKCIFPLQLFASELIDVINVICRLYKQKMDMPEKENFVKKKSFYKTRKESEERNK